MFYLRPGNLFKDFWVEEKTVETTSRGRTTATFDQDNATHLLAALAEATTTEQQKYSKPDHPTTHIITQRGRPKARPGDRLIHGARVFYLQGVDEVGELGLWTIYYAEERSDVDGDTD